MGTCEMCNQLLTCVAAKWIFYWVLAPLTCALSTIMMTATEVHASIFPVAIKPSSNCKALCICFQNTIDRLAETNGLSHFFNSLWEIVEI